MTAKRRSMSRSPLTLTAPHCGLIRRLSWPICATSMKALDGTVFQIIGHTDSSGSAAYNERLSLLRAQEVRRHLISSCGVAEDMLKAIGMGETAPFNQDNTRADENRRVEFQALG